MKRNIRIADAKRLSNELGAEAVVVLAFFNGGQVAGASYGTTVAKCRRTGKWMDWVVDKPPNCIWRTASE
jgi:hypothetical protein